MRRRKWNDEAKKRERIVWQRTKEIGNAAKAVLRDVATNIRQTK